MLSLLKSSHASFNTRGLIFCVGKAALAATTGAVSGLEGAGLKSITKVTGGGEIGVYSIELAKPFKKLIHASIDVRGEDGGSGVLKAEISKADHADTGTIIVNLFDEAGAGVEVAAASEISFLFIFQ